LIRTDRRFDYRNLDLYLYLCPTGLSLQDLEALSAIYASVDSAPGQTPRLIQWDEGFQSVQSWTFSQETALMAS